MSIIQTKLNQYRKHLTPPPPLPNKTSRHLFEDATTCERSFKVTNLRAKDGSKLEDTRVQLQARTARSSELERSWLSSGSMCTSVEPCVLPAQEKGNQLSGRQWNPVDEWRRCRRDTKCRTDSFEIITRQESSQSHNHHNHTLESS